MNEQRKTYADLKDELLITRDQIAKRVKEMGAEITRDFEGKDLTVICILKGAVVFFVDLVREIDLPMTMDFMAISSYGSATKSSGVVRILKDLDKPINGRGRADHRGYRRFRHDALVPQGESAQPRRGLAAYRHAAG